MLRSPRYNSPGSIHHVMLRGNQGRPIFFSDGDRVQCCLLIQEVVERYGHRIHGYCLMSNHIHLAWQQGTEGLSSAVQNFAFRYAQRVNIKYGVSEEEIISESGARDLAHVRAIITLLSRSIERISIIEVAKKLKRDPGGLSRLANKLDKKCTISTLLKHEVISLKIDLLGIRYPANSHCNKSTSHV